MAEELSKAQRMYPTTRLILKALMGGPMTGRQIAEIIDDITPSVARTMANLRERSGYVRNTRAGLGGKALYEITDQGRQALAEGDGGA